VSGGPRQLLRFLAAGGAAALLNFGSRVLFSEFMPFGHAVALAFCVGLVSAFLLSRRFVFGPSGRGVAREIGWFVAVNIAALAQTWLLSVWLAGVLVPQLGTRAGEALAHFAGIMLPVVSSYFGHRYLTFSRAADGPGTGAT
jgi:putative flippase GtrA